ncbi:MAG: DUF4868 domain-containing protein [Phycisphaerales bacterium]|jgi:hypothetical protein
MAVYELNLFAMLEGQEDAVRRIPLSGDLQDEITEFIQEQKSSFHTDQSKVHFSGTYNAEVGEIFTITDYPLRKEVIEAVQNPLNFDILNLREQTRRIVALCAGKWTNKEKYICFQVLDARRIISKGFTILNSGNTYTKLGDPGLTLQDKLTALYQGNELLFYSYYNTRRFLDLNDYYREATDTDLEDFVTRPLFYVENQQIFMENADSMVRKKVALLQKNNVLRRVTTKDIQQAAREYGIKVDTKGDQIVIPSDKKELKELLRFLDEDYFTATLTKRHCLTNSKKYLGGN